MKRRLWWSAILLLCVLLPWWWKAEEAKRDQAAREVQARAARVDAASEAGEESGPGLPAKSSARRHSGVAGTHRPERLKDFYLQAVDINGLSLQAALEKLKAAYEEACAQTGETALDLRFFVPPGKDRPLRATLGVRTLDNSIRKLAALSGLKVTRDGVEYRFEVPEDSGQAVKKALKVSESFLFMLGCKNAHDSGKPSFDISGYMNALGFELDPSTRVSYSKEDQSVTIEGTSAADQLVLSDALPALGALDSGPTHKVEPRLVRLSADVDWTMPETGQCTTEELTLMMRQLAQTKGVDLMATPAVVARDGEQAKVEIIRELIVPVEGSPDQFETYNTGVTLDISTRALGFGHQAGFDYNVTEMAADWQPGRLLPGRTGRRYPGHRLGQQWQHDIERPGAQGRDEDGHHGDRRAKRRKR